MTTRNNATHEVLPYNTAMMVRERAVGILKPTTATRNVISLYASQANRQRDILFVHRNR